MKRSFLLILSLLCLPTGIRAELDITGSPIIWFTNNDMQRFSRGFTGFGAGARLGWTFRGEEKINPVVFLNYSHLFMGQRWKQVFWKPNSVSVGGVAGVHLFEEYLKTGSDLVMDFFSPGVGLTISGDLVSPSFEVFAGVNRNLCYSQPNLFQLVDYNTGRYQTLVMERVEKRSTTFHAGFGARMDINLWKREKESGFQWLRRFDVNCGLAYLYGGETVMVDGLSFRQEEGELAYSTFRGSLNSLQINFGFQLGL